MLSSNTHQATRISDLDYAKKIVNRAIELLGINAKISYCVDNRSSEVMYVFLSFNKPASATIFPLIITYPTLFTEKEVNAVYIIADALSSVFPGKIIRLN